MKHFFPIYLTTAVVSTVLVYYYAPLFKRGTPEKTPDEQTDASETLPSSQTVAGPVQAAEPPPAMSGVYIAKMNEPSNWGITTGSTSVYTPQGDRKGVVKGGEIFRFKKLVKSSQGAMVLCVFLDLPTNREYLIKKRYALLFTGELDKLSQDQRGALKRYYSLRGEIAERKRTLLENEGKKNPYFESYQKLYKSYITLTEKAKRLNTASETKTGLQREAITEELRRMHVEEAALKKKYDAVRSKYNAWKADHPQDLGKGVDSDPELIRLRERQKAEQVKIRGLAI